MDEDEILGRCREEMSVKSHRKSTRFSLFSVGGDNSTYSQLLSLPALSHHILLQMLLSHICQMHSVRFRMWFWLVVHSSTDCMSGVTAQVEVFEISETMFLCACVRVCVCVCVCVSELQTG